MTERWSNKYRNAVDPEREYWLYRFACSVQGLTEEQANARVDVLLHLEPRYKCVWHANWIYNGKPGLCHCTPCTLDRKDPIICL